MFAAIGTTEGDTIATMLDLVEKEGRTVVTSIAPMSQSDVKLDEPVARSYKLEHAIQGHRVPRDGNDVRGFVVFDRTAPAQ
jgi:hypothetical protein